MGSKERITREKDLVRQKILEAALEIIMEEGCLALNMRKISDRIEYAAATIYEYFENKDSILVELTNTGYVLLGKKLKKASAKSTLPAEKIHQMAKAYWSFAFKQRELYKLMFRIQVSCPDPKGEIRGSELPNQLFTMAINELKTNLSDEEVQRKYYSIWSVLHGLIAINLVNGMLDEEMNKQILEEVIPGIIK